MHPFEEYLQQHNLEALTVAIQAKVRYLIVYNATKGTPITLEHANKIRDAVLFLTGVPYRGSLALMPLEDTPTIPMQKLHKQNLI